MNPFCADQLPNESDRSEPSVDASREIDVDVGDVGSEDFDCDMTMAGSFSNGFKFARANMYGEALEEAVDPGDEYADVYVDDADGEVKAGGEPNGSTKSGTNVVWQVVKPPPKPPEVAPQNLGDMAFNAADVEPETSLRGLYVLMDDVEDCLPGWLCAVVRPRPATRADVGAGVISLRLDGTGAIAAFFNASISRLR